MKKLLMIFLLSMILIAGVSASDVQTLGTFSQGDHIKLKQSCDNCTYVNISSVTFQKDSRDCLNNVQMNKTGTEYTYWTSNCSSEIGRYLVTSFGDDNGLLTSASYDFYVTPLGTNQTTAQGIGSAVFLLLMVCLTGIFAWIGFKLAVNDYLWVLGIFFIFLSCLFVVYDVWLGYEYHRLFSGLPNSSVPETIFYIFMFLIVAGSLTSAALLFLKWREAIRYIKRSIKRRDREDNDLDDWDFLDNYPGLRY